MAVGLYSPEDNETGRTVVDFLNNFQLVVSGQFTRTSFDVGKMDIVVHFSEGPLNCSETDKFPCLKFLRFP